MSKVGRIINNILEQPEVVAIPKHNQRIAEKEERIGNFIRNSRPWAHLSFSFLATIGIASILAYSCAGGDYQKYKSAIAHIKAGNYIIAKAELESIPGPDLEYIVDALHGGGLSPESAQGYGMLHHPREDMTVRKISLEGNAVTSLEPLKGSDETDFLAIGTEKGHVYFFNEYGSLDIDMDGVQGNIYPTKNKDYVIVGSQKGVYKLGIEAIPENGEKRYKILLNTLFKADSPIGEIRSYDLQGDGINEYFFTAANRASRSWY